MNLPDEAKAMGAKPSWIGYVGVDDVDAAADRVERLGGAVHVPATDIPHISRFSVVADPQLATLVLVKWLRPRREQPAARDAPGRVRWHELLAADWEKAFAFYAELFGWQKAAAEIDATNAYQLFSAGGEMIGGMFTKPATVGVPFWLYYFGVADIDVAEQRVRAGGGKVLNGPMQVPDGSWIVECTDPQGAVFALAGPRRANPVGYFERVAPRDPSDPRAKRWNW
jgi:predicted enzyme related to lactoylglutathione lyase